MDHRQVQADLQVTAEPGVHTLFHCSYLLCFVMFCYVCLFSLVMFFPVICPSMSILLPDIVWSDPPYCQTRSIILAWSAGSIIYNRLYSWRHNGWNQTRASPQRVGTAHCTPVFQSFVLGPSSLSISGHTTWIFWGMKGSWRDLNEMIWEGLCQEPSAFQQLRFWSQLYGFGWVPEVKGKRLRNHVLYPLKSYFAIAIVLMTQISNRDTASTLWVSAERLWFEVSHPAAFMKLCRASQVSRCDRR